MTPDDRDLQWLSAQLKSAVPPCDPGPDVDLWPSMLQRLDQPAITFGWFEAALAALVSLAFVAFPNLLPALLYHL